MDEQHDNSGEGDGIVATILQTKETPDEERARLLAELNPHSRKFMISKKEDVQQVGQLQYLALSPMWCNALRRSLKRKRFSAKA